MKLKFREKTYIVTLALFLLFFNSGIFALAYYTQQQTSDAEAAVCLAEQAVIARAFEDDTETTGTVGKVNIMHTYSAHYAKNEVYLAFHIDGKAQYSALPDGLEPLESGYSATKRVGGKRYYIVSDTTDSGYLLTYAKDVSYLDEDFEQIAVVFVLGSLAASVILAVILFFVLRKLSAPLEKLRAAAGEIANGNFESRADDKGSDEFSLLASDFNRMAEHISVQMDELEKSAKTKQTMLDNLAHEMRTPLTSIRGYAEYLRDAKISEEERIDATEYIISEAERLRLISERLLDEAFIRENGINRAETDLGELLTELRQTLSYKASVYGTELKTEISKAVVSCDRLLIGLMISNLTDNAIKACRGNGTVVIGCTADEEKTVIFVRDSGVGMTEEQLKHITEPFYRTDKSRARSEGGTGLGLALCEKIAIAHGAELRFESTVGEGTTAKIIFYNSIISSE